MKKEKIHLITESSYNQTLTKPSSDLGSPETENLEDNANEQSENEEPAAKQESDTEPAAKQESDTEPAAKQESDTESTNES